MFSNYLDKSLNDYCGYNVPGATGLLLFRQESLVSVSIDEGKTITSIQLGETDYFLGYNAAKNLNYRTTLNKSKHGNKYDITLSLNIRHISQVNTDLFTRFANSRLSAIIRDANNQYWLLGDRQPLKVTEGGFESGTDAYSIELFTSQKTPPFKVAKEFVDSIVPKADTSTYVLSGYVVMGYVF